MIKRIMHFYDKKQADLIKKVNDKLHKQRGVRVKDDDNTNKKISIMQDVINELINIERRFSKQWTSEERKIYNKAREGANNIIQYIKSKGKTPDLLAPSINYSELKNVTGAETRLNNIKKLLRELKNMPIHNKVNDKLYNQHSVKVGDADNIQNIKQQIIKNSKIIIQELNKILNENRLSYVDKKLVEAIKNNQEYIIKCINNNDYMRAYNGVLLDVYNFKRYTDIFITNSDKLFKLSSSIKNNIGLLLKDKGD